MSFFQIFTTNIVHTNLRSTKLIYLIDTSSGGRIRKWQSIPEYHRGRQVTPTNSCQLNKGKLKRSQTTLHRSIRAIRNMQSQSEDRNEDNATDFTNSKANWIKINCQKTHKHKKKRMKTEEKK